MGTLNANPRNESFKDSHLPSEFAVLRIWRRRICTALTPDATWVHDYQPEALKERLRRIRSNKRIVMHHDNARPYTARATVEAIDSLGFSVLSHQYRLEINSIDNKQRSCKSLARNVTKSLWFQWARKNCQKIETSIFHEWLPATCSSLEEMCGQK